MGRRLAIAGVVLLVALPVVAYVDRQEPAKTVQVEPATARPLSPVVLASGALVYENQVTLVPELLAKVTGVMVKEGDEIRAGQLLLRLDDESTQAELSRLQSSRRAAAYDVDRRSANVELERHRFDRLTELQRQGMISPAKLDDASFSREAAALDLLDARERVRQIDSELQAARQHLRQTEIRSPLNGRVTRVAIKVGETAVPSMGGAAGSILMEVADTDSLLAEVNVDEADIQRVREGQTAQVVAAGNEGSAVAARVERIAMTSHAISGQGRVFAIKLRLAEDQIAALRSGTTCRAEIRLSAGASPVLAVPLQAVHYDDSSRDESLRHPTVFVSEGGRAHSRAVTLGTSDDTFVEVRTGLDPGARVIVGPQKQLRFLREGDRVEAIAKQQGPAIGRPTSK